MADEGVENAPDLSISPEKVCFIIVKQCAFLHNFFVFFSKRAGSASDAAVPSWNRNLCACSIGTALTLCRWYETANKEVV